MKDAHYRLYHYWRSSSSFRLRFALEYKGIPFLETPINLLNGESESEAHLKRNPAGFVPVLEILKGEHQGQFLSESLSIIRYLEMTHPETPTLLPGTAFDQAKIWELAEVINSGTQPLGNMPVTFFYSENPVDQKRWMQHWTRSGLAVFEAICSKTAGQFSYGDRLSLADICLIPQLYNATRQEVDLAEFPTVLKVQKNAQKLEAFQKAHPDAYKPVDFKG